MVRCVSCSAAFQNQAFSPEMKVIFPMKKLISSVLSLLLTMTLLFSVAVAETTDDNASYQAIYNMILEEMDGAELTYERYDDYYSLYLGYTLSDANYGDATLLISAYSDAFTITTNFTTAIKSENFGEVLSFVNLLNSDFYVGKLLLDKIDDDWFLTYEVFVSVDPDNIDDWDRNNLLGYADLSLDILCELSEYVAQIEAGETGANVYAMYLADYMSE